VDVTSVVSIALSSSYGRHVVSRPSLLYGIATDTAPGDVKRKVCVPGFVREIASNVTTITWMMHSSLIVVILVTGEVPNVSSETDICPSSLDGVKLGIDDGSEDGCADAHRRSRDHLSRNPDPPTVRLQSPKA
jgi:hypothetical protein